MWEKIRAAMQSLCDVLEIMIAICVGIALIVSTILFLPELTKLIYLAGDTDGFLAFLEQVFNLVVGIEFMKLLCKPNTDNIIEIVIFLVARHMIIGFESATDIFLSVLSIAILCLVRVFAKIAKEKAQIKE